MINVTFLTPFKNVVGRKVLSLDLNTIKEKTVLGLLNKLCNDYPKLRDSIFDKSGAVTDYINIFVNDRLVSSNKELQVELQSADKVLLFPPVAGG